MPLDPDYPRERLDYMVADSRPAVVLTVTALADKFSAAGATRRNSGRRAARIAGQSQDNLPCRTTPDNAVYVIYTSGSTGRPKARSTCTGASAISSSGAEEPGRLGPSDRVLFKTPMSFDMSVEEFFPANRRRRVVMAKPGGQREPELSRAADRPRGRHGGRLRPFDVAGLPGRARPRTVPLVEAGVSGGETLAAEVVKKILTGG